MVTECPYVVAGITPGQGGREGRPQGEGAQMIGCHNPKECEMQNAETVLGILRERCHDRGVDHRRATYSETGPCGSEEGRAEKGSRHREYLAVRPILLR
jgi:hypothetical protein